MARPTIGIVTTWFQRGAAYVSKAYADVLSTDLDIRIYARGGELMPIGDPEWDTPEVYWGEYVPGARKTFIDWADFKKWLEREHIDILLFNEQQSWDVVIRCKQELSIPIGSYLDFYTKESIPFFRLYDYLLCNTKRHFAAFEWHPNAWHVPWGVDLSEFKTSSIQPDHFFMHNCGFNPYRKGTDLLVDAFQKLQTDEATLFIHSQRELADFPELEVQVKNDPRITWHIEDVAPPGLYRRGEVFVYPSRLDGLGLSLPEALANGIPSVAPDEAPMNEFIEEGVNGLLVKVDRRWQREDGFYWPMDEVNVDALSECMQTFWDKRESLGAWKEKTLEHARNKLDWHKNTRGLIEKLQKVERAEPDNELVERCAAWERATSPTPTLMQQGHRILIALGARKVKRALFGRG